MDQADDDDDLDERLSKVFEERGWTPRPDPVCKAAAPPAGRASASPAKAAHRQAAAPSPPSRQTPPAAGRAGRREKTLLLGLLGTLAGAFAGVLSLKLFVPRPPAGTGPDVHVETAAVAPLEIVEPPALADRRSNLPTSPDPFRALAAATPATTDTGPAPSAFSSAAAADAAPGATADTLPAVIGEGIAGIVPTDGPVDLLPVPAADADATSDGPPAERALRATSQAAPPFAGIVTAAEVPAAALGGHVVRAGDSWWTIAEGAYGDGRLYKALVAWNRALDPRTSLVPGTHLDIPDEARLRAAWPRLVPAGGR